MTQPVPYACELYRRIDDVAAAEWQAVCQPAGNLFLDPRFLKAVERSFAHESEFWYALYRDESGRGVAATCFSTYVVDGTLMTPSVVQRIAAGVRRVWPGFFKYRMLLGGLPVSTCSHQLAIAPGADRERLAASLDATARDLARQAGCWLISFKEFEPHLAEQVDALQRHGYLKARSVFSYRLEAGFDGFGEFHATRPQKLRTEIRRSLKRFDAAGLSCEQLSGKDGVAALFTPEVHQLYLNVLSRAAVKFETVPASFFQEIARQFPDESCFTLIRQQGRIVGFLCGLADGPQQVLLFCGIDHSVPRESDLYFNLIYRGLARGFDRQVSVVQIGAAADEFKQRLGCRGDWLAVYVRGANAIVHALLRCVFGLLFDTRDGRGAPPPVGKIHERRMHHAAPLDGESNPPGEPAGRRAA